MIGLFLSADEDGNFDEVAAVGPLVSKYGDVIDAVIVGNEVHPGCSALPVFEMVYSIGAVQQNHYSG